MTKTRSVALAAAAALALTALTAAGVATAGADEHAALHPVAHANPKTPGLASPNRLSPELRETAVAQGSNPLENPADGVGYYGYDSVDNSPTLLPLVSTGSLIEANKTEPDKNTYLVLPGQTGPDAEYDYGRHFLFQGHETGSPGYVTRVNLDADSDHRITLLATRDTSGNPLPTFDGSSWNPFSHQLLLTAENGCNGGVYAGSAEYSAPSTFAQLTSFGRGGFEGVQTASDGSVWIIEDSGGPTVTGTNGKLANSYVYRFVPQSKGDLTTGTLQALQVLRPDGQGMDTASSLLSQDIKDLHVLGTSFATRWVDVHTTTGANLHESFCATTSAKAAGATPFKRPENGVFRPGTGFRQFFFTETGDTNAASAANADAGGWGGVFRLTQSGPSADTGRLSLFAAGDQAHTGYDNISFATKDDLLVVEDAGDGLHAQRNALDSGYLLHASGSTAGTPLRWLAEGRDSSATLDSSLSDAHTPGFHNEGDNEVTGIHVSDGDPSVAGLLGALVPTPFVAGWRVFWTAQHGDNVTFEVIPAPGRRGLQLAR